MTERVERDKRKKRGDVRPRRPMRCATGAQRRLILFEILRNCANPEGDMFVAKTTV